MAIALDTTGGAGSTTSPITVSLTVSGSNRILWAGGFMANGRSVSSITYNGAAMTQVSGSPFEVDGGNKIYLYYLVAPATGTHDLVATFDANGNLTLHAASFTGASQTGIPDATNTSNIGTTSTPSQTVTTVADNSWAVWMMRKAAGGDATAGTDTTLADQYGPFGSHFFRSTSGKTPAGAFTLNASIGSAACYGIIASFAPSVAASATHRGMFTLIHGL